MMENQKPTTARDNTHLKRQEQAFNRHMGHRLENEFFTPERKGLNLRRSSAEVHAAICDSANGRYQERHDEIHTDFHERREVTRPSKSTSPSFSSDSIQHKDGGGDAVFQCATSQGIRNCS